jgi:hypothetical protein
MEMYQVWVMPEKKEEGSHSKWIETEVVEAKSKTQVAGKIIKGKREGLLPSLVSYKSGTWKVRKI